jgi:uncharacterized protein
MSRYFDSESPFPLSDVSNGEFMPRPPTVEQQAVAKMLFEEADKRAKKLGMSRRAFLRTAAGTATAYMVLNHVHGLDSTGDAAILPVTKEQCDDPEAAREIFKKEYFVMDVQLHHVDTVTFANFPQVLCFLRFLEPTLTCQERFDNLSQMNFIKEVFVDSETAIGVVSGVPNGVPMPVDTMAATRDLANELAGSQRCVSQCMIDPTRRGGPLSVADMERQVKELGAIALKTYTGTTSISNQGGWFLDDEEVSYPMLEEATRLGLRLINVHKGLPQILGPMASEYVRSRDLPKVSLDWPRLTFVAYHSGYFGEGPSGIEEFLGVVRSIRGRRNVCAEIGSSWAIVFGRGPETAAHFIGSLLRDVGSGRIVWGTDSIWWGSPQWQIDSFKAFQIPTSMQEKFGYPPLREIDKRRILGLNAARLYRIKVNEKRCEIANDALSKLRADRDFVDANRSMRPYGPRTRREFLALEAAEQAAEAAAG